MIPKILKKVKIEIINFLGLKKGKLDNIKTDIYKLLLDREKIYASNSTSSTSPTKNYLMKSQSLINSATKNSQREEPEYISKFFSNLKGNESSESSRLSKMKEVVGKTLTKKIPNNPKNMSIERNLPKMKMKNVNKNVYMSSTNNLIRSYNSLQFKNISALSSENQEEENFRKSLDFSKFSKSKENEEKVQKGEDLNSVRLGLIGLNSNLRDSLNLNI